MTVLGNKKKHQIFISSTYEDLKDERQYVQDVILKMNHFPVGMELFSAASAEQWEIIRETIDSTDYYVLIIGFRYGSLTDEGISYTQKEYEYAKKIGVPILAFIKDEKSVTMKNNVDTQKKAQKKLEEFKKEIQTGRYVEWWGGKEDLGQKVMNALYKQFDTSKRPGWVRANDAYVEIVQTELAEQSKKIRELTAENLELRRQTMQRTPKIEVEINDTSELVLGIKDFIRENEIRANFMPIPEKEYKGVGLSEEVVSEYDEYNEGLPQPQIIDQYVEDMRNYFLMENCAVPININVENCGTKKATDAIVELLFPAELQIYYKIDLEEKKEPIPPKRPKLPTEKRMEKLMANTRMFEEIGARLGVQSGLYQVKNPLARSLSLLDKSCKIEGNILRIRCGDIMHTRLKNYNEGICIVPQKKGTFSITYTAICEEIAEEQTGKISVVVR